MRISEIFQSIQGEGPDIGKRAIFVRLHGCNLACTWCDTKYAWDGGSYYELSVQSILEWIQRIPSIKHIIFTGGEPLLQMEELLELTELLHADGRHVAVETNGTIIPENLSVFDLIVVSPKGLNTADAWYEPSIKNKNVEIKFCVHVKNIDETIDWIRSKGLLGIYLMPLGTTPDQIVVGLQAIADKMIETNLDCIVCPRLHILMGVK